MPAAWVSAGAAVLGVANSMGAFGGPSGGVSSQGMNVYDPYATSGGRAQASTDLQNLVSNPSSVLSQPGYQLGMSQGTSAINAQGAAKGMLQSGGQQAALQGFGQNYFQNAYNNLFKQYGALSGATTQTPSGAASAYEQGQVGAAGLNYNMQQGQSANILGLGGYLSGLSSNFGGGGGGQYNQANQQMSNWNNQDFSGNNYSAGMNPMNIVSD